MDELSLLLSLEMKRLSRCVLETRLYSDIAVNLLDGMFNGIYNGKFYHAPDFREVLSRAQAQGVHRIIITGTDLEDSRRALLFCREVNSSGSFPGTRLYCTVGVHPTCSSSIEPPLEKLEAELLELARDGMSDKTVVFVGECGLDFERFNFSDEASQRRVFPLHLRIARATGLPLFLHDRSTNGRLLELIDQEGGLPEAGGVVHSFTGGTQDLRFVLEREGLFVGLNGCGLKTPENCAVAAQIPLNKLLLETDSPWCSLKPSSPVSPHITPPGCKVVKRERWEAGAMVKDRNEPCLIVQVAEAYAKLTGVDLKMVSQVTEANLGRLLGRHLS